MAAQNRSYGFHFVSNRSAQRKVHGIPWPMRPSPGRVHPPDRPSPHTGRARSAPAAWPCNARLPDGAVSERPHVSMKFGLCAALAQVIVRNAEVCWNQRRVGFVHRFGEILWITLWRRLWINFGRRIFTFGEIPSNALIPGQQPQKVFLALRAQNRITRLDILQLNIKKSDLGDDKGHIIQIDGIIHLAGKRLIHALPVIGRGCTFIGRRCVLQRLNPAGKGLHLLNEELAFGAPSSTTFPFTIPASARRLRKASVSMGSSSCYEMSSSSPPGSSRGGCSGSGCSG